MTLQTSAPDLGFIAQLEELERVFKNGKNTLENTAHQFSSIGQACVEWLRGVIEVQHQTLTDPSKLATLFLIVRVQNDLRASQLLSQQGYPVQAISLLGSVYEANATLRHIGADPEIGRTWLTTEADADKAFGRIKTRDVDFFERLFKDSDVAKHYREEHYDELYKSLCDYKHIQPATQRRYGVVQGTNGLTVLPGPRRDTAFETTLIAVHEVIYTSIIHLLMSVSLYHLRETVHETKVVEILHTLQNAWNQVLLMLPEEATE